MAHTPDASDPERLWRETTFVPLQNGPQLTIRAVFTGLLIGAVMCLSNLYVFFKTGWSLGVTLTACILAFALWKGLSALRLGKPLSLLENNALTTVASGAGYMTGGGNMAAFGALLMVLTAEAARTKVAPELPSTPLMVAWFAAIAALGVFVAIPIKRQLINKEGLAFPTGTATAETMKSLHGGAGEDGAQKAKALVGAAAFGGLLAWFRDANVWPWGATILPAKIPATIALPFTLAGKALKDWTIAIKVEVVLLGAGALMSFRTGWSLLLGGLFTYLFLAPALVAEGIVPVASYKEIAKWTVWPGAALLVSSGLTSFALDYKSVIRSFSGLAALFRGKRDTDVDDVLADVEAPPQWLPLALLILGPIIVVLMTVLFRIPWWAGFIALPLAVVMGFVAARVTGETDVTPTKALGPVTQLVYGVITPGNMAGNIMSANVTGGIGLHAADLLTTLKTGWLLGGHPRHQLYAQLFGVVGGALVIVPAFNVLIPDPSVLGGDEWPAPSCLVWSAVSEGLVNGLGGLKPMAGTGMAVGGILGVVLALAEKFMPKKLVAFLPSPSGLGISMVVPGSNAIAMFAGSAVAELLRRRFRAFAERYTVTVASGLIAGESLVGIAIAILVVMGVLQK
jgi:OPT family oligopeptide transporter